MIHYALTCSKGHSFDAWFKSSDAYASLKQAGHVTCSICGTNDVRRALMAPSVSTSESKALTAPAPTSAEAPPAPSAAGGAPQVGPSREQVERALGEMRRQVEENSEYVGLSFAKEARAMHDGEAPERSIYGEAKPEEARKLIEDGVPVTPLPFIPKRKTH